MAKCFVAAISEVSPIPKADNIQLAKVLGEWVVVGKAWGVGKEGLFFPADTKLSEDFCKNNNLHRDSTLNNDQSKTGFFDASRRVRCQPFMKCKSEGFFCELQSLAFCGKSSNELNVHFYADLNVGDVFEELNGWKICEKYISEKTRKAMSNNQKKKVKTVETPMFNKHVDTANFQRFIGDVKVGMLLSFHAKVHGTSFRVSNTKVIKQVQSKVTPLRFSRKGSKDVLDNQNFRSLVKKHSKAVSESWEYIAGTRNVVLHQNKDEQKEGFHGSEQYRFDVLQALKPHLEKGMTLYGEIAGFVNGSPVMGTHSTETIKEKAFNKKYGKTMTYTYGCAEHEYRFHIYRITSCNEEGVELDYTDQQVNKWCESKGLIGTLEVHPPMIYTGDKEALEKLVEDLTERPDVLCEDYIDPSHISEGIIVRADCQHLTPKFFKSKSYPFKVMEGIWKETNVDVEDAA